MTNDEYTETMEQLVAAVRTVAFMSEAAATDEELKHLSETIERADDAGMFMVRPIDYPAAMRNLDDQRRVIALHREIRKFYRDMEGKAAAEMFAKG